MMMKLLIYENHTCEVRGEELFEGRPSQLYPQLMQLRKERGQGFESRTSLNFFSGFLSLRAS